MWLNKFKFILLLTAVSCTTGLQPLSVELLAKFQPGVLPFEITEETFYTYGEWEWQDSSVVNRSFPELTEAELRMLGDASDPVPDGMVRRTAALKILGPVDGRRLLLYRHDIRPVEDLPSAPQGSLKFVAVLMDENNRLLDRQILADWKGRYTLQLGTLDEHFGIRTITRPYDSDQPDTLKREEEWRVDVGKWQRR